MSFGIRHPLCRVLFSIIPLALTVLAARSSADELIYAFEGDVLPTAAGWIMGGSCDGPCEASLNEDDGYFVLHWPDSGELVNYLYRISDDQGVPPQPTSLWAEWRFRSDQLLTVFPGCDGSFLVRFRTIFDGVGMFGDAVHSRSPSHLIAGLDPSQFHTYRFQSLDGLTFTFSVDGVPFYQGLGTQSITNAYLAIGGGGFCGGENDPNTNEWDYIRYGTLSNDPVSIVASDPPTGSVNPSHYPNLDRVTVTFDVPHYIYVDEIDVRVTGVSDPPIVEKTWRLQNGAPEALEIVLDRPMPVDELTTITINDGKSKHILAFDLSVIAPCCVGEGTCSVITETECLEQGGSHLDVNLSCEGDLDGDGVDATCGDPCPSDNPDDSDGDGVCDSEDQCSGVDDSVFAPECIVAIPAASTWGLVVLSLTMLVVAKLRTLNCRHALSRR